MDAPPWRAFDLQRSVVALCLLTAFGAVLRGNAARHAFATGLAPLNLPLHRLASTIEMHLLQLCRPRAACLSYLEGQQRACRYMDLFAFRMPSYNVEINKHGSSVLLMRKLMERCGYELVPRGARDPPHEVESLMEWVTAPGTGMALAREQPEFGLLRDMSCLFKFLATMESRESELQRQRVAPSEDVGWGLSFEDSSMEQGAARCARAAFPRRRRRPAAALGGAQRPRRGPRHGRRAGDRRSGTQVLLRRGPGRALARGRLGARRRAQGRLGRRDAAAALEGRHPALARAVHHWRHAELSRQESEMMLMNAQRGCRHRRLTSRLCLHVYTSNPII